MHIVIMGCGRVGATLAAELEQRGHSVSIIDRKAAAFKRLAPGFNGFTVTGEGHDRETLVSAGIEHADAFAAVSSGDNSNIIAARVARETFGVTNVATRIYDPRRAEVYERLGIPTVAAVSWVTEKILQDIIPQQKAELWRDPSGIVALVEVRVHPGWIGLPIGKLEVACASRVAFIERFGAGKIIKSSTVLQDGDHVFMMLNDEMHDRIMAVISGPPEES